MIKVENLSFGYSQKDLYKNVSFTIEKDKHCALIGTNGTGKSTLINLIMNREEYLYDGKIQLDGVNRIGYVSQFSAEKQKEDVTTFEYISQNFVRLEKLIADYCKKMETGEDLETILEEYQKVLDEFNAVDGDFYESNIKKQLKTAELQKLENHKIGELSAGEFKLVQIIKEMMEKPDILIMDEPDVFLDFAHINSLRNLINGYKGTMIMITHNRYMLNHCFNKIIQLENAEVVEFDGTYIEYNYGLLGSKLELMEAVAKEEEEIERQTEILTKARAKATIMDNASLGRAVHARQTIVDRLKVRKTKTPYVEIKQPEIQFQMGDKVEGENILSLNDYSVSFDEQLLEHVNFELKPTEHVAIIGDNGTGKTTLLREIYENKNQAISINEQARVLMFSQFTDLLDDNKTPIEIFKDKGFEKKEEIAAYLEKYSFTEEALSQLVRELSGGERDLLQLAVLSLDKANLLLLDEPTGHLDVYAQIALEEAISAYEGAVLMVSHDFYTVANCVDYVILVENNTVRKMSNRKFRQMIYANYFDKDYLILEREKKEIELKIGKMIQRKEFDQAKVQMDVLDDIIKKMKKPC